MFSARVYILAKLQNGLWNQGRRNAKSLLSQSQMKFIWAFIGIHNEFFLGFELVLTRRGEGTLFLVNNYSAILLLRDNYICLVFVRSVLGL